MKILIIISVVASFLAPSHSNVVPPQVITSPRNNPQPRLTLDEMKSVLQQYNDEAKLLCNRQSLANWDVQTNVGVLEYQEIQQQRTVEYAEFRKENWNNYWRDAVVGEFANDEDVARQLFFLKNLGTAALEEERLIALTSVVQKMSGVYNSAKICPFTNQDCDLESSEALTLDPHIETILANSINFDELEYVWTQWHDKSGKPMREDYGQYVELMNEAAQSNEFEDASKWWQSMFEDPVFEETLEDLWAKVEPLYNELHKYVKYRLIDLYGASRIDPEVETLPAHVFGNMWGQSWVNLYGRIKPFKNASAVDATSSMQDLGYDALKMFEMSNDFYMSMGLPSSEVCYGEKAIIEKPEDRVIACHASAWDFCDGEDFRVKMCTKVNMEDFITVHHEMGHIMYYLMYRDLPLTLRGGANPGFHEAVGDTIALSMSTPNHLKEVNLLGDYADSVEDNINALFHMALERVSFLPFGLLIDKWRWEVFNGTVQSDSWNSRWWELREQYQKIHSPVQRNEEFFDPGAKYHVPANSQYISYFVAHILEFQMYKSLCIAAGQYNPEDSNSQLHKCDFYKSEAAGEKLRAGLQLGASRHWSEALEAMTGERTISADAILEYFAPLMTYLQTENAKITNDIAIQPILATLNNEGTGFCTNLVAAEWNVNTNVNNATAEENLLEAVRDNAEFNNRQYDEFFRDANPDDYFAESVKRQINQMKNRGQSALPQADLTLLTQIITRMDATFNNGVVCPYDKQDCSEDEKIPLNPNITSILAESSDYLELAYYWTAFRNVTGKLMRTDYKAYVELVAQVAELNDFEDYGALWRANYEDDYFEETVENLWLEVQPLYNELHTYVKRKLASIYPEHVKEDDEFIPAHILGNMWAQSWVNLYERIKPYSDASDIDVTESLQSKFTVLQMFEEADRFYSTLGMPSMAVSFNRDVTIIEKPDDRLIVCHASAWDFCDGEDYRVKMCTTINMVDFVTIHHELGHILYFMLYKDQTLGFRGGANPGYHEAVGDLIALSVSTPKHLEKVGLLTGYQDSVEDNINALFKMALERVAFLPFGYMIDKWRWDVFSNKVDESEWNAHWWEMRKTYQKVSEPVSRSEEDFDPGAKSHVPTDYSYIAYFVAHILEFQMQRALCIEIGQYDPENPTELPLHKCDIEGSLVAGQKIRDSLSLGASRHWSEALWAMTGESEMSGRGVNEYFQPLMEFLKAENERAETPAADDVNENLVGIIVGSVIGGILVIGFAGYGIYRWRKSKAVV